MTAIADGVKDADVRKAGERTVLTINGIEYAFRWCPAGTFMMGSPEDEAGRYNGEVLHQVTLSRGFYLLETAVTQEMWESVMGNNPSSFKGMRHPVEEVAWNDCRECIEKLNDLGAAPAGYYFSLPTEAQWEYACRAGTTTAYHFGETLNEEQANFGLGGKTVDVASYPANAWGLYDMHGNVWEWCWDWYGEYPSGTAADPAGHSEGHSRVIRGGYWCGDAEDCRSASRSDGSPQRRNFVTGFRLALIPNEELTVTAEELPGEQEYADSDSVDPADANAKAMSDAELFGPVLDNAVKRVFGQRRQ